MSLRPSAFCYNIQSEMALETKTFCFNQEHVKTKNRKEIRDYESRDWDTLGTPRGHQQKKIVPKLLTIVCSIQKKNNKKMSYDVGFVPGEQGAERVGQKLYPNYSSHLKSHTKRGGMKWSTLITIVCLS